MEGNLVRFEIKCAFGMIFNISFFFLPLDVIKSHGTFWAFAVIVCISLVFVVFCVPETQGKTLEDIERTMNGRVRRMSSVANMKPLSFNM